MTTAGSATLNVPMLDVETSSNVTLTVTEVERLAQRIETCRNSRIPVTFPVRARFLTRCRQMAEENALHGETRVTLEDLLRFRTELYHEKKPSVLLSVLGCPNDHAMLLRVLDRAVTTMKNGASEDGLYYEEFSFYHTIIRSRWPWIRSETGLELLTIFLWFMISPLIFCLMLKDEGVCPSDPTEHHRKYYGWVTSLYFTAQTLALVGYGDVTLDRGSQPRVVFGSFYIIANLIVTVRVFSVALDAMLIPIKKYTDQCWDFLFRRLKRSEHLYVHIRCVQVAAFTEIVVQFLVVNAFGALVALAIVNHYKSVHWNVYDAFYWSFQTTATIGYGDVLTPFELRGFQIFFLILGTYSASSALGRMGRMRRDIDELRRKWAWKRRAVYEGMISEMQANNHDDEVDEYEFVLSSLLTLGKVTKKDLSHIVQRYRTMAGPKGFISMANDVHNHESGEPAQRLIAVEEKALRLE